MVEPKAVQEARGADRIIEGHAEGILDLGVQCILGSKCATDPGCKLATRSDPKPATRFGDSCFTAGEMPGSSPARLPTPDPRRAGDEMGRRPEHEGSLGVRTRESSAAFWLPGSLLGGR
jgi:hypothetical protein